jgi:hypothetical protein
MDTPMNKVEIRPMERLKFSTAKSRRNREHEECSFPITADRKEFLEFRVRIGDWTLPELGQAGHLFHWIVDTKFIEEVV